MDAICPQASLPREPWFVLRPSRRMLREACRSRSSMWPQPGQTKVCRPRERASFVLPHGRHTFDDEKNRPTKTVSFVRCMTEDLQHMEHCCK